MTACDVALRALGPGDAAALAAIHAGGPDDPWTEAAFARLLALPGTFGCLAVASIAPGPLPTGFVLARAAGGEAEILALAVASTWRRRGIGRRLVEGALAASRARGALRLLLEVGTGNAPALALYRTLGFAPVGRRPGYYARAGGVREDALVMARPCAATDV